MYLYIYSWLTPYTSLHNDGVQCYHGTKTLSHPRVVDTPPRLYEPLSDTYLYCMASNDWEALSFVTSTQMMLAKKMMFIWKSTITPVHHSFHQVK